jgi:hypothetical protein
MSLRHELHLIPDDAPVLVDEDMTPMHTTMVGVWNGVEEVQQGCPSRRGGTRIIRFES